MDMYQLPIFILSDINLGFHPRDSVLTPVFTPDTLGVILKNHYRHVIFPKANIDIFRDQPDSYPSALFVKNFKVTKLSAIDPAAAHHELSMRILSAACR